MTLLLLRRYLAESRLILMAVMGASAFATVGDAGVFFAFLSMLVALVVSPARASLFEAALPISGRTIVRARLLATYVVTLAPLIVWFVAVRISRLAQLSRDTLPGILGVRPLTDFDRAGLCAIIAIGVTLPLMISSHTIRKPSWSRLVAGLVTLLLGSALILFALPAPIACAALSLSAIAFAGWTLQKAPESFLMASLTLEKQGATAPSRNAQIVSGNIWIIPVMRSMFTPQWIVFTALLILQTSAGSWIYTVGVLLSFTKGLRQKFAWMAGLPVSQRGRLMMTLVPAMIGTFGAIIAGQFVHVPGLNWRKFNPITWQAVFTPYAPGKFFSSETRIKLMYWEIAPNDIAPVLVSPSGETVTAYTLRVPGLTLYNPYSSNEKSSREFIAWQYARASTRVYGHAVPLPKSYADGLVFPAPLYNVARVQILNASATLCFLLVLYIAAEFRSYRSRRGNGPPQYVREWFPLLPGLVCIAVDGFYGTSHGTQIVVPLAKRLLLNLSDALPSNIVVVILVAALPVAILYRLIEWQSTRLEFVRVAVVKKP